MSILRFTLLIFALYITAMLFGAAITQGDVICLAGSSIWLGVSLIVFPVFRDKKQEVGGNE